MSVLDKFRKILANNPEPRDQYLAVREWFQKSYLGPARADSAAELIDADEFRQWSRLPEIAAVMAEIAAVETVTQPVGPAALIEEVVTATKEQNEKLRAAIKKLDDARRVAERDKTAVPHWIIIEVCDALKE